jgi:SAM-dependent methyltransferase
MHPRFVSLLACPRTGEPLSLEKSEAGPRGTIVSGFLASASGARYPIIRGIPRFVGEENYSASFGFEWNRWPRVQFESENVGKPMQGHTTRMWERIVGIPDSAVSGKTIVEFGCGPGRFLDVVRAKGGLAVGLDLSQAVEAARHNFKDDPDVLIVQGDILHPPFRAGAFDGGYTIGVLHHTPDPAVGMRALAQRIKSGGWTACCVYPKQGFYNLQSVARFRRLHNNFLKPYFGYGPTLVYSHFAARVLAYGFKAGQRFRVTRPIANWLGDNWIPWLWFPDARWRVLDIFDGITPSYASTHIERDVHQWMDSAGCTSIRTTDWCETSATAIISARD